MSRPYHKATMFCTGSYSWRASSFIALQTAVLCFVINADARFRGGNQPRLAQLEQRSRSASFHRSSAVCWRPRPAVRTVSGRLMAIDRHWRGDQASRLVHGCRRHCRCYRCQVHTCSICLITLYASTIRTWRLPSCQRRDALSLFSQNGSLFLSLSLSLSLCVTVCARLCRNVKTDHN